jgi:hypothetical protein
LDKDEDVTGEQEEFHNLSTQFSIDIPEINSRVWDGRTYIRYGREEVGKRIVESRGL